MRIERVQVESFLGLRNLEVACDRPILLVCGPNGSGKSSVADAVRFALLGEPGRVRLKKDYSSLLPPGAKDGRVVVTVDGREVDRSVRSGNGAGASWSPPPALECVLDAQRFVRLEETDRRRLLLKATGIAITPETIAQEVETRGLSLERFGQVSPVLRSGFEAAAKECARYASEARGAWKAVAGEAYGEVKAETWTARAPEVPEGELEQAVSRYHAAQERARAAGDARARLQAEADQLARAATLRATAGRLPELLRRQQAEETDADALAQDLRTLEVAAHPPQGLVMPCPACGVSLAYASGTLAVAPERAEMSAPEAYHKLQAARQALAQAKARVEATRADVGRAEAAREALASLPEVDAQALDAATREAEAATAELAQAEQAWREAGERARAAEAAERRTREAAGHHADVMAWSALAEALSPDGIPAELLGHALGPVNDRLRASAQETGWMAVEVSRDMRLTAGGRDYGLLSESERWRADAMLAEAIAHVSGLWLLVLDRLDVLDLANRAVAMRWLVRLAEEYDTILVAGTLKAPPALPDMFRVVWLGAGVEVVAA